MSAACRRDVLPTDLYPPPKNIRGVLAVIQQTAPADEWSANFSQHILFKLAIIFCLLSIGQYDGYLTE